MKNTLHLLLGVLALAYSVRTVRAQYSWPGIAFGYAGVGMTDASWITYGNGKFLAINGYIYAPPGGTTSSSVDGFHWTVHPVTNSVVAGMSHGVAVANSNFVAFGDSESYVGDPAGTNGLIQFSPDGLTWSQPLVIPSVQLWSLAYGNGTYVAVGQSSGAAAVATSNDGTLWKTQTFPGQRVLYQVAFGSGSFVAVGGSEAVLTSSDGSNWLAQAVVPGTNVHSIVYGQGMFVANAQPYSLTSKDGTNWVITPPDPGPWSVPLWGGAAYGNGLFVGIGNNIQASTNGVSWQMIWGHQGAEMYLLDIAYGAGAIAILVNGRVVWNVVPRVFLAANEQTNGLLGWTLTGGWLGQQCRLQATTDLPATNWADVLTFTNQGSGTLIQDPTSGSHSGRFYRIAMP